MTLPSESIAPKHAQQLVGLGETSCLRGLEPREALQVAPRERSHREHRFTELDAHQLRVVLLRAHPLLALRPQPTAEPGSLTACAAAPLGCRGERDRFRAERVEAGARVTAQDTSEAAVDHGAHAIDRDRGLRDVGRDDDLAAPARANGAVLLFGRQLAVQG